MLGDHPFIWRRLDKVKGNKRGALKIVDEGGVWKISGRHQGQTADTKDDYVAIKGTITAADNIFDDQDMSPRDGMAQIL